MYWMTIATSEGKATTSALSSRRVTYVSGIKLNIAATSSWAAFLPTVLVVFFPRNPI